MSRPVTIFWPLASNTAVSELQTLGAAGSLIINGNLASKDDSVVRFATFPNIERNVSITSAGINAGVQFTIRGTLGGENVFQTIAGPSTNTVYTTQKFTTVTSVTVNGALTGNVSVGTGLAGSTIFHQSDYYRGRSSLLVAVFVEGGVVSYTFKTTPAENLPALFWNGIDGVTTPTIPAATAMTNCTVSCMGNYQFPTNLSKVFINSSDANTSLQITFLEQGVL